MVNLDDGEAAFIAARVRRLCKTFGYPVPDAKDDEFVVCVSGSLIGGLLTDVEARKPAAWMNEKRDMTYLGHYNAGDIPLYTEHLPDPAGTNTSRERKSSMTDPKKIADGLRRYNAWRRNNDEGLNLEMPNPTDLGKWIEEAANTLDSLTEPEPIKCETCEGAGKIDERLGGYHTSNANAQCPDCDGAGYLESIHDFRPGQWWVKELDGIQASQEATPDQKRAVAVVHNLLRHILKLERTERTAGAEGAQAEEALPGNVLAQRAENLEAQLKVLREQEPVNTRLLDRISDAMQSYERHGAICIFEGSPMIYAATLTEIADIAAIAESAIETPAKVSNEND